MSPVPERQEEFEVCDSHLVRRVIPACGKPYVHRCPLEAYRELAWAAEDLATSGFNVKLLVKHVRKQVAGQGAQGHPWASFTNAAVALAFWRDRGLIETQFRRNRITDGTFFESAMVEFLGWGHKE